MFIDPQGLPQAQLGVQLDRAHHPPQHPAVHAGAAAVPVGEAACQKARYGAPLEVPEDLGTQAKFL